MSGLDKNMPTPTEITLHQKSPRSGVALFRWRAFFAALRTACASIRRRPKCAATALGRRPCRPASANVEITALEPVGNYAIQPTFSMDTTAASSPGICSTITGKNQEALWADYLARVEPPAPAAISIPTTLPPKTGGGCGKH